jgi:hypothetical protein
LFVIPQRSGGIRFSTARTPHLTLFVIPQRSGGIRFSATRTPNPTLFVIPQRSGGICFSATRTPHLTLFVIPQRSGGICFSTATTRHRHHPEMIHPRVLRQVHLRHRKHHPLARRRDLRIAHPLHLLQIRKGHRPSTRHITLRVLRRTRDPRSSARRRQQTYGNQSIPHGASLTPATEKSAASVTHR